MVVLEQGYDALLSSADFNPDWVGGSIADRDGYTSDPF